MAAARSQEIFYGPRFNIQSNSNRPVCGRYSGWIGTPLNYAIDKRNQESIERLIDEGADPDGVDFDSLLETAAFRLRFVNGEYLLETTDPSDAEIMAWICAPSEQSAASETRLTERPSPRPFWTDGKGNWYIKPWTSPFNNPNDEENMPITSIVHAASIGSPAIIDFLLSKGADTSFWSQTFPSLSSDTRLSFWCCTTPLHAAIAANEPQTVQHLLDLGLSPNATPLADPSSAVSALIFAVMRSNTCPTAVDMLCNHPAADFSLRSRACSIHVLHAAAATLNLSLLRRILLRVPLSDAGVTALRQNLLHIVSLPEMETDVKAKCSPASESVRSLRQLSPANNNAPTSGGKEHAKQSEMFDELLERLTDGVLPLLTEDVYGNLPLHYLAACQEPNEDLIRKLRIDSDVENAWQRHGNAKGHTPRAIYTARAVVEDVCVPTF